jgi:hypothetical protein
MNGLERFSKNLELHSASAKPIAKAETTVLFKELYRWIGDACFKDFKIHPEVKDEVAKFAKEYQKGPLEIRRGIKRPPQGQG